MHEREVSGLEPPVDTGALLMMRKGGSDFEPRQIFLVLTDFRWKDVAGYWEFDVFNLTTREYARAHWYPPQDPFWEILS